jgi:hypothetical protein
VLGLGHLGQAYCWSLGFLPYADASRVTVALQDVDRLVGGNQATSLLACHDDAHTLKTRMVAQQLEKIGFETVIVERRFDARQRRRPDEPGVALAGFDNLDARRALGDAEFDLIVDAGLGHGVDGYLDMMIHAFPAGETPAQTWSRPPTDAARAPSIDAPAYKDLARQMEAAGSTADQTQCGLIEIAGRTVAAAFVGAAAGALVISEVLRSLCGGPRYALVDLSLRGIEHRTALPNDRSSESNPGFVLAAEQ